VVLRLPLYSKGEFLEKGVAGVVVKKIRVFFYHYHSLGSLGCFMRLKSL